MSRSQRKAIWELRTRQNKPNPLRESHAWKPSQGGGTSLYHGGTVNQPKYCPTATRKTPDMPVAVVMETGYSTAFWGCEGKGFISFDADRTSVSLILLCTLVENEFLA
ncbi:hypothetical protein AVEN_118439-1 [Araneus ventricosus]|uniref:Uncharacterized protein n=1 Tax=Araneus ventricosus TaxID=182803 RepID=A0A4Y2MB50_ARAVE|nr:hypothetical protein AVEN_118439-1 [Araneus ventricosus]